MEPFITSKSQVRNQFPESLGPRQTDKQPTKSEKVLSSEENKFEPFGKDGLSFYDVLDMINPLHHIPIVNSIYRQISGDQIEAIPRIAGGSLFFGPLGLAGAALNVIVENITGKDIDTHLSSLLTQDHSKTVKNQKSQNDTEIHMTQANKNSVVKDPVTSWAEQEVSYRRQLAIKKGLNASINEKEMPIEYIPSDTPNKTREMASSKSKLPYMKTHLTVKNHSINFSI